MCVIFGMGPFYYLASIEPFAGIIDALPTAVALAIMFLIPIVALFVSILALLAVGGVIGRRLARIQMTGEPSGRGYVASHGNNDVLTSCRAMLLCEHENNTDDR